MYLINKHLQRKWQQVAETHKANIQKTLQHRLEVARAKGDENLIHQLEEEWNYCR